MKHKLRILEKEEGEEISVYGIEGLRLSDMCTRKQSGS